MLDAPGVLKIQKILKRRYMDNLWTI